MAKTKANPKPPQPDLVYETEGALPKMFLIWYGPESVWWRANSAGYTSSFLAAGTYSEEQARAALSGLERGDKIVPLDQALREQLRGANPQVLAAIAALGGR